MGQPNLEQIEIHTDSAIKGRLQQAADLSHQSVSEFLIEAGLAAAEETLAGRQVFRLDDEAGEAFQALLDRPVQTKTGLRRLLNEPGVFDRAAQEKG